MMPVIKWLCHVNFDNLGARVKIPPKMQRSYSDENNETPKAIIESCRGMDNKLVLNVEGSPQYYHRQSLWH